MITLLLADPQEMVAESLRLALDGAPDLTVTGVATSFEVLERLVQSRPADVVLLDQRLPSAGSHAGVEAGVGAGVRRVRELSPDSRVLMLTASPNEAAAVVALEAGCVGVIPKTMSLDDLVAAVRGAAAGRLNIDSDMLARLVPRLSRSYREPGADLTMREREVLRLVAEGLSTPDMASRLVVSTNTVRNHVQSILSKLGAHSKLEALVIATRGNLLE
ncbi:MAG TPA: response regulator transcription factor [Frankiaceae bacterium]|nr:response regulator transcription factor [Frankiaceae bacterium]